MNSSVHYKIGWGDTINSIAQQFDVLPEDIMYKNQIEDIYVGLILVIPQNKHEESQPKETVPKTIEYYLKRHAKKKHIFNFYSYQKSHR